MPRMFVEEIGDRAHASLANQRRMNLAEADDAASPSYAGTAEISSPPGKQPPWKLRIFDIRSAHSAGVPRAVLDSHWFCLTVTQAQQMLPSLSLWHSPRALQLSLKSVVRFLSTCSRACRVHCSSASPLSVTG